MGGKFEVPAAKQCWSIADQLICDGLLARLEVLVGRLAYPWRYGWGRQLFGCRRSLPLSSIRQHSDINDSLEDNRKDY